MNNRLNELTFPKHELRALALLRVSTDAQDEAHQRRSILRVAKKYGITIVRWLELHGVSGKDTLSNEQVQQLLRESAEYDGVIVVAVDRLIRPVRPADFAIGQLFQDFKKYLWTDTDGVIEMWKPEGYQKFITAGLAAAMELQKIVSRSTSGKAQNLTDEERINTIPGGYTPLNSPHVPYGYKFIPHDRINNIRAHMIIDDAEATIVRRCFSWALQGVGCYEIARRLNLEGVPSKRAGKILRKARPAKNGKPAVTERVNKGGWSKRTVWQMFRQEAYTGTYLYKPGSEDETRCTCPAIIGRDVWQSVQLALPDNAKLRTGPRQSKRQYELTGLGRCMFCGHRLTSKTRRYPKKAYQCGNRSNKPPIQCLCTGPLPSIDGDALEQCVFDAIWSGITEGDTLCNMIAAAYADTPDPLAEAEAASIRAQIEELKLTEERAHLNMRNPHYPYEQGMTEYEEARRNLRNAEFRLAQANAAAAPRRANMPASEAVRALAAKLRATRPQTFQERVDWLQAVIMEFRTDGERVTIEIALPETLLPTGQDDPPEANKKGVIVGECCVHSDHKRLLPFSSPLARPISFVINTSL